MSEAIANSDDTPGSILELRRITKIFPGVKALDDVHFDLRQGEIHGLMGENGAGKSTFIKIITGVHAPDTGEIVIDGRKVEFKSPIEAQRLGVAAIYQHVTCYPDLSVAENIFMGHEKVTGLTRRVDWKAMHGEAQKLLDRLDANFSSRERMGALSVARQQIVEIAKALSTNARIVIMDEPTAALTQHESNELYRITEQLCDAGVSVIFISHRLEDIRRLAQRVTVFRDGRHIGCWPVQEITQDKLVVAMVGREISTMFPKRRIDIGEEVLRVANLTRIGYFRDVSFTLRQGEILALTGLVGAGRTEVCETLYGIARWDSGSVLVEGREVTIEDPLHALRLGIGCLPEDRQRQGLVLPWEIGKNITLPSLRAFSRLYWMDEDRENQAAGELARKLNVKASSIFTRVLALSGGNQQKVVVAKILSRHLKIIILDEPTKGVDVGAKAAIYDIIGDLAEQGYGIILISSEMPEVLGLSDRIVVMKEGRVTAQLETANATQEQILKASMVVDATEAAAEVAAETTADGSGSGE
ncbi:MAG: sugar ABC transporter ATP-binding protein [Spirochaetaceae bacterium]|nr:MAG: sugar ABC transporter ATP-binding protein [Spirochaetaceae bacterium]